MAREKQFNFRFNEGESERLAEVAAHYDLKQSEVVRMLLKKEHDRLRIGRERHGRREVTREKRR